MSNSIQFEDFTKVDLRVGTIVEVNDFPEARNPAFQLKIDFGGLGVKKTSAQKPSKTYKHIYDIHKTSKKICSFQDINRWCYGYRDQSKKKTDGAITNIS